MFCPQWFGFCIVMSTVASDSAVSCPQWLQVLRCSVHSGFGFCGVVSTVASGSVVSCPQWLQILWCSVHSGFRFFSVLSTMASDSAVSCPQCFRFCSVLSTVAAVSWILGCQILRCPVQSLQVLRYPGYCGLRFCGVLDTGVSGSAVSWILGSRTFLLIFFLFFRHQRRRNEMQNCYTLLLVA